MAQMEISNDGIAIIDGVFDKQFCDKLISFFMWSKNNHGTWNRLEAIESIKNDESCILEPESKIYGLEHSSEIKTFNEKFFNECYPMYVAKFSVLNNMSLHGIFTYKIQKTEPTGGYHIWHCEVDSLERARRLGTYILYLNDVEEGGETEFLYLSRRVKPKTGRLVIFPAGYVHTHRGNPPLSGDKFIMTGWLEFMQ